MPLWGYPIGKNYQKRQRLRGAWSAASCTVRGIKSRPLRFFFAVAARAASVIGFSLFLQKEFFSFFFFVFFFSFRSPLDRQAFQKCCRVLVSDDISRCFRGHTDRQDMRKGGRLVPRNHLEISSWFHGDSMHIQILLPEEFSGSSRKFFPTPGKFFW